MGFKEWIIPQEHIFFDLFLEHAKILHKAMNRFYKFTLVWKDKEKTLAKLDKWEHDADMLVHKIYHQCNTSFITPFDREDITCLAYKMDEVLDYIQDTMRMITMYGVDNRPDNFTPMVEQLLKATKLIQQSLQLLHDKTNFEEIKANCIAIHSVENEIDTMLFIAMSALFKTDDVKTIVKHKVIFEYLEEASDNAEDVANVLSDIMLKNT